jgi:hypothetical protein
MTQSLGQLLWTGVVPNQPSTPTASLRPARLDRWRNLNINLSGSSGPKYCLSRDYLLRVLHALAGTH